MFERIEEHVIVSDADILVGVPCYKDGPMVDRCLRTLIETGVQLLIVDNGSPPDVKQAIEGRGIVLRNDVNRYVNPAWNQMMRHFIDHPQYDMLVIANSDLELDAGWAAKLRAHRQIHPADQIIFGMDAPRARRSAGSFFVMTRAVAQACCPIPLDLLIMGGDDFIFHVSLGLAFEEHVLSSLTMTHVERGTYDKSPEIWEIARRDTDRWNEYVLRVLVPQRIHQNLASIAVVDHVRVLYVKHLLQCRVCQDGIACAACASNQEGGHACNCHQEGGGKGYRLRRMYEESKTVR